MNEETKQAVIKIMVINIILMLILGFVTLTFLKHYTLPLLLGLLVSGVSFSINAITTDKIINNNKEGSKGIIVLLFVGRVLLVCGVGFALISIDKDYIISYAIGYSFQFISMIIFGKSLIK